MKKAIKKAGAKESTWDKWLHFVLHAIRITEHSSTGHTPYQLLFGRKPTTPISSLKESLEGVKEDLPLPVTEYLSNLKQLMEDAKQTAEEVEAKDDTRKKVKASSLEPGQPVLCFEPRKQKGLAATWLGPYTVKKKLGDLTYLIDMGHGKVLKRHRNAIKKYSPDTTDISIIVCAELDEDAPDKLTLGPTTDDNKNINIPQDIRCCRPASLQVGHG